MNTLHIVSDWTDASENHNQMHVCRLHEMDCSHSFWLCDLHYFVFHLCVYAKQINCIIDYYYALCEVFKMSY